jgi:hypothetical protein
MLMVFIACVRVFIYNMTMKHKEQHRSKLRQSHHLNKILCNLFTIIQKIKLKATKAKQT